jgi:hypothetical protein
MTINEQLEMCGISDDSVEPTDLTQLAHGEILLNSFIRAESIKRGHTSEDPFTTSNFIVDTSHVERELKSLGWKIKIDNIGSTLAYHPDFYRSTRNGLMKIS